MSRRRKASGHGGHERWLVSYADFITLLFAFFVVLYATSQIDNKRIAQVSTAIHGGFQELGAFSEGAVPGAPVKPASDKPNPGPLPKATGFGPDINLLKSELEEALGHQIENNEIQIRITGETLIISLAELGFFNSGEATLLPEGVASLGRIARILNSKGFEIRVEGHTDNVPIHTARFRSNWELSTARATEVVSLLVEQYDFDPRKISAAGYSEFHPVASNDKPEGRRQNRRVDVVVVSRSTPEVAPKVVAEASSP